MDGARARPLPHPQTKCRCLRSPFSHFVYSAEVAEKGETLALPEFNLEKSQKLPRNLLLSEQVLPDFLRLFVLWKEACLVFYSNEARLGERIKGINQYWRYGKLDPRNNVCFGEGGRSLPDGKLITRIKSPHIPYVMNRLVQFGAPAEIQWLSNPHVGSDRIRRVIPKMREFLKANGCEIHFNTQVTELLVEGKNVVGLKTEHGTEFKSPRFWPPVTRQKT